MSDPVLQRAIRALEWAAQTVHQGHHHGIVFVDPRPHPTIPEAREADPINLDAITWRECPRGFCESIRSEIAAIRERRP